MATRRNREGEDAAEVERVHQQAERLEAEPPPVSADGATEDPDAFHLDPALVEAAEQSELVLRSAFLGARSASRVAGRTLSGGMSAASGLLAPPERAAFDDPPARVERIRARVSEVLREGAALLQPSEEGEVDTLLLERLVRSRPGATLTAAAGLGLAAGFALRKATLRVPLRFRRRSRPRP